MKETEKQEEDLVGEYEKEDEGRAQTALGELQGGGGKHTASVFQRGVQEKPRELNTSLFQGS